MIQLYKKGNTLYSQNGDHVLQNISCELDRTLNGSWELSLKVPLDDAGVFLDIVAESVIKAPTPEGDKLFAVYDTEKVSEDSLEACARPVFLNAADEVFLLDTRPTTKNGQEVLDILTAGTKYSGRSNITKTNSATYIRKNLMEALASDNDNSFLNRWGGEVLYDDFSIVINDRVGGEYGASIRYGKNLAGMSEKINIEGLVTRIVPVAYNDYTLGGDTPWVDSPLIDSYEHVRARVIHYDDVKLTEDAMEGESGYDTLDLLRAELIRRCNLEFEAGIDKPKVTIEADMIDLENTVEYKDYAILEKVSLGDTVHCQHSKLGVTTIARVIRQKWDCILQRNISLVIGDFQNDYFSQLQDLAGRIQQTVTPSGTVRADTIQGIINSMNVQLRAQKSIAQKQEVRAMLFEDLDPDSPTYGAMSIGTMGLQISSERTEDGRDWDWTTAVTAKGAIADIFIAGILSDKSGENYWNLDTGEIRLTSPLIITNSGKTLDEDIELLRQETTNTYTRATQTANEIVMEAVKDYTKTSDLEAFKETMNTLFEQNSEEFVMTFNRLQEQITNVDGDMQSEFAEIKKYIRFVDGSIVLGEEGNQVVLTIENDRISFTQNGIEVCYISNAKMGIREVEITERAKIVGLDIYYASNGSICIN